MWQSGNYYHCVRINSEKHKDILRGRVVSIHDFIGPRDCAQLYTFCQSHKNWPNDFYERGENARTEEPPRPTHRLVEEYMSLGLAEVSYFFAREMRFLYPAVLRKYPQGTSLGIHCDGVSLNESGDGIDYSRDYDPLHTHPTSMTEGAMVLYINDDYDGGELFFPDIDLEIKPKSGQLIAWPSGPFFEHGVRQILNGDRFVINSFLTTPKLTFLHNIIRLSNIALQEK